MTSWRSNVSHASPGTSPLFGRPGFDDLPGVGAGALSRVETIGFDYGQRHVIELSVRPKILGLIRTRFPKWAAGLGTIALWRCASLPSFSDTALT